MQLMEDCRGVERREQGSMAVSGGSASSNTDRGCTCEEDAG
jgi:hypothetical protein